MKGLLRYFLINTASLYFATITVSGFVYTGGARTILIGGLVFAIINFLLIPFLRILLLPLNLLTLGLFAWTINVLAIYALTSVVSGFYLTSFSFGGFDYNGITIPAVELNSLWSAFLASVVIGVTSHFLQWLSK
jgi:putative membrane protein